MANSRAPIPEFQCRFRWKPDSVAFWDKRSCQHYAASDYWPYTQRMERVTIVGDVPAFRDAAPALSPSQMDSPFRGQVERYQLRG